ncbi:kinesin-like protein KIF19 isoform X4 [Anser cygnoides]
MTSRAPATPGSSATSSTQPSTPRPPRRPCTVPPPAASLRASSPAPTPPSSPTAPPAAGRPTPCWALTASLASVPAPWETSSRPSRTPAGTRSTRSPCPTSRTLCVPPPRRTCPAPTAPPDLQRDAAGPAEPLAGLPGAAGGRPGHRPGGRPHRGLGHQRRGGRAAAGKGEPAAEAGAHGRQRHVVALPRRAAGHRAAAAPRHGAAPRAAPHDRPGRLRAGSTGTTPPWGMQGWEAPGLVFLFFFFCQAFPSAFFPPGPDAEPRAEDEGGSPHQQVAAGPGQLHRGAEQHEGQQVHQLPRQQADPPAQGLAGGQEPHGDDRPHQPRQHRLRGVPQHARLRRPCQEHPHQGETQPAQRLVLRGTVWWHHGQPAQGHPAPRQAAGLRAGARQAPGHPLHPGYPQPLPCSPRPTKLGADAPCPQPRSGWAACGRSCSVPAASRRPCASACCSWRARCCAHGWRHPGTSSPSPAGSRGHGGGARRGRGSRMVPARPRGTGTWGTRSQVHQDHPTWPWHVRASWHWRRSRAGSGSRRFGSPVDETHISRELGWGSPCGHPPAALPAPVHRGGPMARVAAPWQGWWPHGRAAGPAGVVTPLRARRQSWHGASSGASSTHEGCRSPRSCAPAPCSGAATGPAPFAPASSSSSGSSSPTAGCRCRGRCRSCTRPTWRSCRGVPDRMDTAPPEGTSLPQIPRASRAESLLDAEQDRGRAQDPRHPTAPWPPLHPKGDSAPSPVFKTSPRAGWKGSAVVPIPLPSRGTVALERTPQASTNTQHDTSLGSGTGSEVAVGRRESRETSSSTKRLSAKATQRWSHTPGGDSPGGTAACLGATHPSPSLGTRLWARKKLETREGSLDAKRRKGRRSRSFEATGHRLSAPCACAPCAQPGSSPHRCVHGPCSVPQLVAPPGSQMLQSLSKPTVPVGTRAAGTQGPPKTLPRARPPQNQQPGAGDPSLPVPNSTRKGQHPRLGCVVASGTGASGKGARSCRC